MIKHWFDTREGKLVVGEAAYEQVVEQSGPGDIVPLDDLITRNNFDIDYTYYDKYPVRLNRSEAECIAYGKWVLKLVTQDKPDLALRATHFKRLSRLGLGMGYERMNKVLGGISHIRQALETSYYASNGSFKEWSMQDFCENAETLAAILRRRPKVEDYNDWAKKGRGPGHFVIKQHVPGGIKRLNECIGYLNVGEMDQEDYIEWGVRVMQANKGQVPIFPMIQVLSRRERGPSIRSISLMFGRSFANFQKIVIERYDERRADLISRAAAETEELADKFNLFGYAWPEDSESQVTIAGRYRVIQRIFGKRFEDQRIVTMAAKSSSHTLISNLQKHEPLLTAGEIEVIAVELNVFDDIWPLHKLSEKHLQVSGTALALERKRAAHKRLNSKQKRRMRNE